MDRLTGERRAAIVSALTEGNSIRSTARMTGVSRNTVDKLLVDLGTVCPEFQDRTLRNLPCKRIQVDEIWSFCYAKQKNVPADKKGVFGYGDVWTWTAICADTKVVPGWLVAGRDGEAAESFAKDLASRMANRIPLTSDGHKAYLEAVESAFGGNVDYSMLVKHYGAADGGGPERKYSPNECVGCRKTPIVGEPDLRHVSTAYAERQNRTMRMRMRRFTRLTDGFSKKIENHCHAIALYFFHYNFIRIHQTLRVTPAMRAGVTDRLWRIDDLVRLLEESEIRSNVSHYRISARKSGFRTGGRGTREDGELRSRPHAPMNRINESVCGLVAASMPSLRLPVGVRPSSGASFTRTANSPRRIVAHGDSCS